MSESNVVPLRPGRHCSGPARCTACGHEWQAVAPVGVQWLECPACETMRGLYVYPVVPDGAVWGCSCGGDLFYVLDTGLFCRECGQVLSFDPLNGS